MDKQITVWIGVVLLLSALNFSQAQVIPTYFEDGGKLTLRPTVSGTITNILWKYNGNLLAEWVKGEVELFYYDKYKDRTTLNIATGQLDVVKMKKDDVGLYTVEINNKVHGQSYDVKWITKLPVTPTVEFRPLTCGKDSESCSVTCDGQEPGSLSDAEPIEYSWKIGEKDWEVKTKDITVTSGQTQEERIETITCRMKNPVSQEDSEPKKNPMYAEPEPTPNPTGPIVGGVFVVLALVVVGIVLWKYKPDLFTRCKRGNDVESGDKATQDHLLEKDSPGAELTNTNGAEPKDSAEPKPDKTAEAEPKNSAEAPPKDSTGAELNNTTGAQPKNSAEAPNDSSKTEPDNPPEAKPPNQPGPSEVSNTSL